MTTKLDRRKLMKQIGITGTVALLGGVAGCTSSADSSGDGDAETEAKTATSKPKDGSSDGEEWTKTDTVDMNDKLKFAPKRIKVASGTTVTWKNVGAVGHTVTAYEDEIPDGATYFASGGFDSEKAAKDGYPDKGNVTEGGTYEHTFETKGTYKYYCVPHEMNAMVGYVKVV
ncbi:copper-binding protein [Halogeometricum borinquense]|uniref:Copper-binding protein n=1 Tax=Halogeometricum borinquense TaxID=60847 RepID=A0A6C0UJ92_9EURY|nr:copper-binding protein [Halogeometricum borinquense]